MKAFLSVLLLAHLALAQSVMSTSEIVITPNNGFWTNALNTSNPTGSVVFTAKDGSQWICFAEILNNCPTCQPIIDIAHVVKGTVTLTHPNLPQWSTIDQHNACSIALDKNNFIHLTYDQHVSPLHYFKSLNPNDGSSFSGPLSMLGGVVEAGITFPVFFTNPATQELYFTFQHSGGANADQYFYHYNASTLAWEAAAGTVAGQLSNYVATTGAGPFMLSGLPQWDKTTGNLWFNWQRANDTTPFFGCGSGATPPAFPCGEFLLGWNGASFIQFGGTAQPMPIVAANSTPASTISSANDANFTILDSISIDANGTFFLPFADLDGNGFLQVYVLESSTGSFVRHQLTSNQSAFAPPSGITWLALPSIPGGGIQSITAVSSGTCTWVTYGNIYNWGSGQVAYQSCNNFRTSQVIYLTTKFSPNIIIFPDQVRNYRDGSISFLFEQTNDTDFRFSNFLNGSSPNLGKISLITWSPGGCSDSGTISYTGTVSEE
jgi:hypothetical protein